MRQILATTWLSLFLSIVALGQTEQSQIQNKYLITGQVVDESGQPVSGATVTARPNYLSGRMPISRSDQQGRFTIPVNRPGRWYLTASKITDGQPSMALPFYYPLEESIPYAVIEENQPAPFVTVRLGPRAGKLTVIMVDEVTQQPINQAEIALCRVEAPRFCYRQKLIATQGKYQVLVPASPFMVQISAEGYQDWFGENGQQRKQLIVASNTSTELNVSLKKVSNADNEGPKFLEAPRHVSPASGTVFFHFPRVTRLEWAAVPAAVSYTVEVEFCSGQPPHQNECQEPHPFQGLKVPPTSGLQTTNYEFEFLGNQPGRWRVWAVDAQGRPGAKSEWALFFYRTLKF